jgi:hypothetical protein
MQTVLTFALSMPTISTQIGALPLSRARYLQEAARVWALAVLPKSCLAAWAARDPGELILVQR